MAQLAVEGHHLLRGRVRADLDAVEVERRQAPAVSPARTAAMSWVTGMGLSDIEERSVATGSDGNCRRRRYNVAMPMPQITWDDVQQLPENGNRYEAIGGALYMTPAPSVRHQAS